MAELYSSRLLPDPESATDVLAFVLCPLTAFVPAGDEEELAAVADIMAPIREQAVERFLVEHRRRQRN